MINLSSILKSRDITLPTKILADKDLYSQSYVFSSIHAWMWELNHKEGWAPKNWCFKTVQLEKTLESPLDSKDITPTNAKGNQPWKFIGRTDAEAEAPILWPPNVKSQLIGKDSDAGKDARQKKRVVEDEMLTHSTQWTWMTNSMDMNLSKLWETVEGRGTWYTVVHGVTKSWTQLSD